MKKSLGNGKGKALYEVAFQRSVGKKVKASRRVRSLTQQEVATKVNISRPSLVNIEKGQQSLSLLHLTRFATVLNLQPGELIPSHDEVLESMEELRVHTPHKLLSEALKGKGIAVTPETSNLKDVLEEFGVEKVIDREDNHDTVKN